MRRVKLEPEPAAPVVRVQRILVKGLLGRFDHEIPFNLKDRITIIHGPNGFGKTVLLRLIDDLFSSSNSALLSVPYSELHVDFDNRKTLSVVKIDRGKEADRQRHRPNLHFILRNGTKTQEYTLRDRNPGQLEIRLDTIDEVIPELDREGPEIWRNLETDELLSLEQVLEVYGEKFRRGRPEDPPEWLIDIRHSIKVRFIRAERLQAVARPNRARFIKHGRVPRSRAVQQYSEELGALIKQTLTEYAALSQSLDRTFPVRVVTRGTSLSMSELQVALKEIEQKRARLVEAGLLVQEGEETTVQVLQHVDKTNLPVLSVYVQDTREKLSVFDNLVAKVELFKKSVTDRFLYKQISIGKDGFTFKTPEGDQLDPLSLSSGEQHEIVLFYELLFQATENSLILLDEPEISLHVAWQEQFLSDLRRITALSQFDALIATHSPQIISDRWDLTVELHGPKDVAPVHTSPHSK